MTCSAEGDAGRASDPGSNYGDGWNRLRKELKVCTVDCVVCVCVCTRARVRLKTCVLSCCFLFIFVCSVRVLSFLTACLFGRHKQDMYIMLPACDRYTVSGYTAWMRADIIHVTVTAAAKAFLGRAEVLQGLASCQSILSEHHVRESCQSILASRLWVRSLDFVDF